MIRRPWPILLLAILQFLTPVIYLSFAAGFYGISFFSATREVYELNTTLRNLEIFLLPVILGLLIIMTKRTAYFIAMILCAYGIVRGVIEFIATNQTDPVFPIILSNAFCIAAIAYLARPKARNIYLNPRLRWWETDIRYVVNFPASVTRVGATPKKATLKDIAAGGAGVTTIDSGFLKDEIVTLEFQYEGTVYNLQSRVMWERAGTGAGAEQIIGLKWEGEKSKSDRSKVRRLIRILKAAKTPSTRQAPPFWSDLKTRLSGDDAKNS